MRKITSLFHRIQKKQYNYDCCNKNVCLKNSFAPDSTGDLVNSKWLYEFAAEQWSEWLPESALSTLRIGGYYSYVFRPGYRIIVLNNNLCFEFNM